MKDRARNSQIAAEKKLGQIEEGFRAIDGYNGYLFNLYLTYIRRNRISYDICQQALQLKLFLESKAVEPLLTRDDIRTLDRKNPLDQSDSQRRRNGYPFKKIGFMLEELGVIEPAPHDYLYRNEQILAHFEGDVLSAIRQYLAFQKNRRRSEARIYNYLHELRELHRWLNSNANGISLLHALSDQFTGYFDDLVLRYKKSHIRNTFYILNGFYQWCVANEFILHNPVPQLNPRQPPIKHTICSDTQIANIMKYIKNPDSDPQLAMLLVLCLLYAADIMSLKSAQLIICNDSLKIIFQERKRSFHTRFVRPQELILPIMPKWLGELQQRFYGDWLNRNKNIKKTYPRSPLFTADRSPSTRSMGRQWLSDRIAKATELATGTAIPMSILRQTGGMLHRRGMDASMLRRLGWAEASAFHYTWAPVTYYLPSDKNKS